MWRPNKLSPGIKRDINDVALDDGSLSDRGTSHQVQSFPERIRMPDGANGCPSASIVSALRDGPAGLRVGRSQTRTVGTAGRRPAVGAQPIQGTRLKGHFFAISQNV
jgi:hypothetical protein